MTNKQRKAEREAWVMGWELPNIPIEPTQFEKKVAKLGLRKEQYESSEKLKEWVSLHKDAKYVPEWLLEAWHMTVEDSYDYSPVYLNRFAIREALHGR